MFVVPARGEAHNHSATGDNPKSARLLPVGRYSLR
jgi:hypothetical protein